MSRPLLVIAAFVVWAVGSTYWYTCKLKRVCTAEAPVSDASAPSLKVSRDLALAPTGDLASAVNGGQPVRVLFPMREAKRHYNVETAQQLQAVADQLKVKGRAIVTGFSDGRGGTDSNTDLGMLRAQSVRDELIKRGAPAALIEAMSAGEGTPMAGNDTIMGRQLNRRVEVTLR